MNTTIDYTADNTGVLFILLSRLTKYFKFQHSDNCLLDIFHLSNSLASWFKFEFETLWYKNGCVKLQLSYSIDVQSLVKR